MHRPSIIGALMLLAGSAACSAPTVTPSAAPASSTPLPAEPCDGEILAEAVQGIMDVDGYRFTQEFSRPHAPRRVGDERVWKRTLTSGAYLAPDRYREEIVQADDPRFTDTGFLRAVRIGGAQWWLVRTGDDADAEWIEVPADAHGGNVLTMVALYVGGANGGAKPAADAPASLPGEGGCVMAAGSGDPEAPGFVAVRIDPTVPRVVAFAVDNAELRLRMAVTYDVPAVDEFEAPRNIAPDS